MGDHDIGQLPLPQQVTIGTLPDDVLLKIFKIFINATYCYYNRSEEEEWWCTMLVHVCQRWRNLVFTSPRHLNLQLHFKPPKRSVKRMLDIWPELPICIHADSLDRSMKEVRDDVVAALRLTHPVSGIRYASTSSSLERSGPLMEHPF